MSGDGDPYDWRSGGRESADDGSGSLSIEHWMDFKAHPTHAVIACEDDTQVVCITIRTAAEARRFKNLLARAERELERNQP